MQLYVGSKIFYHVRNADQQQWVDYENLTDHLQLVISYEKERKMRRKALRRNVDNEDDPNNNKIVLTEIEGEEEDDDEGNCSREISNLVFIDKKERVITFKAYFSDGSFKLMTNKELRRTHPLQLLDFYEHNIEVSFN
jgi:hypothetical protein